MSISNPSTPSKGQAWFCTIGLPTDVVVDVEDMTFHLHKFPLMSKSKKLHDMITLQESPSSDNGNEDKSGQILAEQDEGDDDVTEVEQCHVSFPCFPGGSETFEAAAKFCYGVKTEITAANVAPLRCAGEVLEMTEEHSEDNLISRTETFFSQTVLQNIRAAIAALKSCERLSPMGDNLGIVARCIDAISTKAALYDPTLFGWPVTEVTKSDDPWIEDLAQVSSEIFNRVISGMREKQMNQDIIENCLIHYAKRCFPGISRSNRNKIQSTTCASEAEQREVLERIVSELPSDTTSQSPATTRVLFGLLRTANILSASDECKARLECRIGMRLDQATLDDLLIPSYSYLSETLYDVDCVERIVGHFLKGNQAAREVDSELGNKSPRSNTRSTAIMLVGKLIDGYLSEIASDANLKVDRFYQLAGLLPEQARLYDDGVYRAIDVYLKAHPGIDESDKEKLCGLMDYQKLTLEACTHAAQNERLPLRAVVQVLFFEQLQLRHAIAGTLISAAGAAGSGRPSGAGNTTSTHLQEEQDPDERDRMWREAVSENQVLRLDMDSMRARVMELERECSSMKKVIEKMDKVGPPHDSGGNKGGGPGWRRKFGCKLRTQVCDSHESTVVDESRRGRSRNQRL